MSGESGSVNSTSTQQSDLEKLWQDQKQFQLWMTGFNLKVETDKAAAQARNRVADAVGASGR